MSTDQAWYVANQGNTVGPMSRDELVSALDQYQGPNSMVYGPGTGEWVQARNVPGLVQGVCPSAPPPAPHRPFSVDEIEYELFGDDMQFVEITLDPGETVIAEAGTMMYMTQGINMETVMGDPNKQQGIFGKLVDAGKIHRQELAAGERLRAGYRLFGCVSTICQL